MDWKTMLSYISGSVDEELLLRNEYLVTENRILRNQLQGRLRLTDGERRSLAELGKRLGKQALDEVASIVNPDTILGWHRRVVAKKFDGSENRPYPGRPRIDADVEELVVPSINLSCVRLASCLQPGCLGRLHVGRFEDRRRLYSGV